MPLERIEKAFKVRCQGQIRGQSSRSLGFCLWNVYDQIISFVIRSISMKLATNVHHSSGKNWTGFPDWRSNSRSRSLEIYSRQLNLRSDTTHMNVDLSLKITTGYQILISASGTAGTSNLENKNCMLKTHLMQRQNYGYTFNIYQEWAQNYFFTPVCQTGIHIHFVVYSAPRSLQALYMLQHIRLSVRPSVRPSHSGIVSKRGNTEGCGLTIR